MPYQRTCSTLGCPDLSFDGALALARRHGLAAIELRALAGTTDLPAYFAKHFREPAALANRLRTEPIKINLLDTSFKLQGATVSEIEAFGEYMKWAETLSGSNLRVFDGGRVDDNVSLREMVKTISWWRELQARHCWQFDVCVETHDSLFTAAAINEFIRLAPGTKILWDTHHTWKIGGEDPLVTWNAIKAHVAHIHVKDSVSQPSANHPFTYVLPGDGEFPMAPLREVLQAEYSGMVSLEWEKLWHPYLPFLDEALTAATARQWW